MYPAKILIVDDDLELARVTRSVLTSRGYDATIVHTGEEAMAFLRHRPNLILLDLNLPDCDGLEVCRKMREDRAVSDVPIIIISGRNNPMDKVDGLFFGADDYLTKPVHLEEMLARIQALLRRSLYSEDSQVEKEKLRRELKKIIAEERIIPFFQPIFAFPTMKVMGFEALGRPPQSTGFNNPEFLFRVALKTGLYFELEHLCWRKAIAQRKEKGITQPLFLNCNPYLVECNQFNENIFSSLGIDVRDVVLELTERFAILDYALFAQKLKGFMEKGMNIAVDDVGGGYASLNTVAEVKPKFIKIDMSLIRSINKDPLRQNIVEAIVGFSKKSKITTIAEGIENKDELKMVMELGVEAGQGYLLAQPLPEFQFQSEVKLP